MHFKLAAAVSLLPFLVSATSIPSTSLTKVPLSKSSTLNSGGKVNVSAVTSHVNDVKSKIFRGFEQYQINTGKKHPKDKGSPAVNASGTDPLTDVNNGELWSGSISVGTPPVTFTVDFDTGSSDLYLTNYNAKASSSAVDQKKTFFLEFGDGSTVNGEQFDDVVGIAGLTATQQRLGQAKRVSGVDANQQTGGLMGMAFEEISVYMANPVFQTLVAQGQTAEAVFGFTLLDSGAELVLGGVDNSAFTGTLTQVPVDQVGFWEITLDSVTVGSQPILSGGTAAVVDTGTTLLLGDTASVQKIYEAIPGSQSIGDGEYAIPCDAAPNVTLTLGGQAFTLSADTFNFGTVEGIPNACLGGIVGSDVGFWVLGDVFMRNVYTSFDVGNKQVGFASLSK